MIVPAHCDVWLIISDHYHARLLGCNATPTERCHVTRYGEIESPIPDIEFGRPIPLTDITGDSYVERQRRLEEEYRRFAKQLARWINRCIDRFGIKQLTVFVPEQSHKDVLTHIHTDVRDRVTLRSENLLRLSPDALSKHHLVTELMRPQNNGKLSSGSFATITLHPSTPKETYHAAHYL